jgi:hypothetical protein
MRCPRFLEVMRPMMFLMLVCFLLVPMSMFSMDKEVTLKAKIRQLVELRTATINAPNDEMRLAADKEFRTFLEDALMDSKSFSAHFDTIPQLADLKSGDGFFRMINWNLPMDDQTHLYRCFIQFYDKKAKSYKVIELKTGYRDVQGENRKVYSDRDWYGCLYYKIIPSKTRKSGRKRTYMLLGWDGHDEYSSIKLLDALTITSNNIRFGADIFDTPEKNIKRFILEYKSDAFVSLKYDERKKWIIFNQLVPMQDDLVDLPEFYIPVMQFDALEWRKRKWTLIEDVDARTGDSDKKYNNPPLEQKLR